MKPAKQKSPQYVNANGQPIEVTFSRAMKKRVLKLREAKEGQKQPKVNDRLERARKYCNQLCQEAERKGLPKPVLTFVVDNDCCDTGPIVFPVLPRKGEFIEANMIWNDAALEAVRYRVGAVIHSAPQPELQCEVPHVTLILHLATDDELYAPWPVVIKKPKHLK